jgi:cell filamentation protein
LSDPYVDPATGVLRNRLGISDPVRLSLVEGKVAVHAEIRLYVSMPTVERCDLATLQAVHRRLFGDVYDWAGELRTVDIAKGGSTFALARHLRHAAAGVFSQVPRTDRLRHLDARRFVATVGRLLADLNALHPFREGNGRAQRAFMQPLARDAGYQLRWGELQPPENIAVSEAAMSDPDAFVPLLERILVPASVDVPLQQLVLPRDEPPALDGP